MTTGYPMQTTAPPRLFRSAERRVFGGVVAGLCDHVGLTTARARWVVRAVFIGLAFASGLGVALYGAYWVVVPSAVDDARKRPLWVQYVFGGVAAAVLIAIVAQTGSLSHFFVPIVLAVLGGALVWRQSSDTQREQWTRRSASGLTATARGRAGAIRLLAGASLIIVGGVVLLTRHAGIGQTIDAVLLVLVVAVGFALITGPIWAKMARDLSAERRERIRAQERSELAAHLHDSVLQTLALVQRNAENPREVARLARGQERELRTLLYGERTTSGTFADGLRAAAGEVEDSYAVNVDVVVVSDAAIDDALLALVQAAREAMVNAAKHSGVDVVSVYAEVEPEQVIVYVRDRGRGFDPVAIPAGRQGLRGSIRGRVERHGGTVRVRSGEGEGTEIEMRMARTAS